MSTFFGDHNLKDRCLSRARTVGARLVGGEKPEQLYWTKASDCPPGFVCQKKGGCSHKFYADELSLPTIFAYAERALFLELPPKLAAAWPERIVKAVPVGIEEAALEAAVKRLSITILGDSKRGLLTHAYTHDQTVAIEGVLELFQTNCEDAESWNDAFRACQRAENHHATRLFHAVEARAHAGSMAAMAAGYFARTFADPRCIANAIKWAPWPARYTEHARLVAPADEIERRNSESNTTVVNGMKMCNVGVAMLDYAAWARAAEAAEHQGELLRQRTYVWYAQHLVNEVRACRPRKGIRGLLSGLAGVRTATAA